MEVSILSFGRAALLMGIVLRYVLNHLGFLTFCFLICEFHCKTSILNKFAFITFYELFSLIRDINQNDFTISHRKTNKNEILK